VSVGEETGVPDMAEAVGEDVEEEPAEKGGAVDREDAFLATAGVVAPAEADPIPVASEESVVGESDAVGVAGEVVDEAAWCGEGLLGVDDPLVLGEGGPELAEVEGFVVLRSPGEPIEDLAAKDTGESTDGEEETGWGLDPSTACGVQAAGGDDAVDMGMERELLSPGVEYGDDAGLGAEMSGIPGEREQGIDGAAQQEVVQDARPSDRKRVEPVGEREDDVEVVDREQFGESCVDPAYRAQRLALRAVAIAARPEDRALVAARRADFHVAPEGGGAAPSDRP
jgi:hypothetical protein